MSCRVELVVDDHNRCGEGPIWDRAGERLIWTDIDGRLVFQYHPATGGRDILSRDLMVAGIALNGTGELVFAGAGGLHLWRGPDGYRTLITEYEGVALCFNDIIADARGRIYAGTLYWGPDGMERLGKLYLIDRDGAIRIVDEGIELSNGLGFSPDDRTLYYADSAARSIYAYDVEVVTGSLPRKRVFVQVPGDEGIPDGLTVDSEGYVWSAQWYGAQVVRYDRDGKVERRIAMPVTQVSSLAFGGAELSDLYITSAAEPWSSRLTPAGYRAEPGNVGGPLYRVRFDIPGKPEHLADLSWPG